MWGQMVTGGEHTGNIEQVKLNDKMMHDIQMVDARLVEKAPQLLGNCTTN